MSQSLKKKFLLSLYDSVQQSGHADEKLCYPIQTEIFCMQSRYDDPVEVFEGGVKQIQKVYDKINGRYVALAIMKDYSDPEALERFYREARLTSNLQHPNIMPIYDLGYDDNGVGYFTMKFFTGDNLATILKELKKLNPYYLKRYPLTVLLGIFNKICDAISYAHANNVLHLDIKPANVQIGDYGEVIVCDWGLAKIVHEQDNNPLEKGDFDALILNDLTIDGILKGTPGHMAPEQIDKTIGQKCFTTDIYSLGVILYQILTRKRPIEGTDLQQILERTIKGEIIPPSQRSPHLQISESLEAVCMKAVQLDPKSRYQTVADLQKEVEAYLTGFATEAEEASFMTQLRLFYHRNRRICTATILFSLVAMTFISYFIVKLRTNEQVALQTLALYEQEKTEKKQAEKKFSTERNKRIEALKRYSHLQKVNRESTIQYLKDITAERNAFKLDNAKEIVEKALKVNPKNRAILEFKAGISIAFCDFQTVLKLVKEQRLEKDHPFATIALKYKNQKLKRKRLASIQSSLNLLQDLVEADKKDFATDFLGRERYFERKPEDARMIMEFWLLMDNPQVQSVKFKISQGQPDLNLDLSGNTKLQNLKPLYYVRISHLDISETNVSSLGRSVTTKRSLTSLNIANTKITKLRPVLAIPNLKKLIVSEGQFPKQWFKKLPKKVELEIIPRKK